MSSAPRQDEERVRLQESLEGLSRRARSVRDRLSAAQVSWPPPGGGWSIGQVFEHLCIANDSYLEPMERLIQKAKANSAKARIATWQATVMGGFLLRSFRSPRRLPTPKMYRPGPEPREGVVDAFLERQDRALALLAASSDMVWQDLKMRSPVTALIRLNLGDAFAILVTHAERHFGQIERTESQAGFPR